MSASEETKYAVKQIFINMMPYVISETIRNDGWFFSPYIEERYPHQNHLTIT